VVEVGDDLGHPQPGVHQVPQGSGEHYVKIWLW
jgi:hypothetical protein